MKYFLFVLALGSLILAGCSAEKATLSGISDDVLFAKRLECGRLLEKIDWSIVGPEGKSSPGVIPLNPLVFYSPKLNTCVLIEDSIGYGKNIRNSSFKFEHIEAINLLTGQTLEGQQFDLLSSSGTANAKAYGNQLQQRYSK